MAETAALFAVLRQTTDGQVADWQVSVKIGFRLEDGTE